MLDVALIAACDEHFFSRDAQNEASIEFTGGADTAEPSSLNLASDETSLSLIPLHKADVVL